ncbi:eukaryotic translation initiation factor 4E1-like [Bombyx mandarina]|uniref:eIF-4F 25 kDa subunit n=1 Tax=Bombyx mandarina TaxID=7092 RepID=A0A6J2KTN8_BOMMA|nr:eukaryotic translation initiation factor 4E1-like [Bombyx mandarina]
MSSLSSQHETRDGDTSLQSESSPAIKHPLEHTWSYWLYTNKSKEWIHNLVELSTFATVEDYWCLYHYMKLPSELNHGQDYMIFKKGIQPTWEDPINEKGGRWIICESKSARNLDPLWLDLILMMIGENFEHPDLICGVVVNIKAKSKISLWTRGEDKPKNMKIGKTVKEKLNINRNISYFNHNTTSAKYFV